MGMIGQKEERTMATNSCRRTWQSKCLKVFPVLVGLLALLVMVMRAPVRAQQQPFAASGVWTSSNSQSKTGTWQVTGTGTNSDLSGAFTATGPADVTQGSVFGTTNGDSGDIKFGILYNDTEDATFTGTVAGGAMSGTYTTKAGDAGTWSGSIAAPQ